ncbi:MAG: PAS domain-containing protein, partial [Burkholderiaceae bacterium]
MPEHDSTPSRAPAERQTADALDAGMFSGADPRHLAVLCEHTPNFVACVAGPHHVCTHANGAFLKLIGARDPVGRPLCEAVPEWNGQKIARLLDDARNRRERIADHGHALRIRRENGAGFDTLHIHLILLPVTGADGGVEVLFIVGIDVTAQRRSQQDLLESTERTALALHGGGDGAWDMNPVTRQVVFSARWKDLLGYGENEVVGTMDFWQTLVHPDDVVDTLASLDACLAGTSASYSHEHRMRCRDGSWKWVLARGVVVARDDDGCALRVAGTMTDISETRLLTDRLQQSHDLLKNLSEQVPGALFQFHLSPEGRYTMPFASAGMRDMFEVEPEEAVAGSARMLGRVHPDDRQSIADSIVASGKALQPWSHEIRVLLPRQGLRWRLGKAQPERRTDGSVLWHGFMADITERKRIEEELARLALIARKITTAVLITDAEGRIEWANEAFTVLTGYSVEEVTGRKPGHFLQGPDTDPASAQL